VHFGPDTGSGGVSCATTEARLTNAAATATAATDIGRDDNQGEEEEKSQRC